MKIFGPIAAVLFFLCAPVFVTSSDACTDVLNAFLSVEKLNEKVRDSLIAINTTFQRLDVALSRKEHKASQIEIGKLIDCYFDFYLSYFQNPPAQFIDDPKWQQKLTDVNSGIKTILKLINTGQLETAHAQLESAYKSFSAIYIDRIPMQEQNVIELIQARISTIEIELSTIKPGSTSEIAIHANNLKSLAERFDAFETNDDAYKRRRAELAAHIAARSNFMVITRPDTTAACELLKSETAALKATFEVFINSRKKTLDKEWFK